MVMNKHVTQAEAVQLLLQQVEAELKAIALWQDVAPTPAALASTTPFCLDTLSFNQWLQFFFLPKMQYLLDAQLALPQNMAIAPMAEEAFKYEAQPTQALIKLLMQLDELF